MRAFGIEELRTYRSQGRAIAAFSVYNGEQVRAVVTAARSEHSAVLLQAGASSFGHLGRQGLIALALAAAEESTQQVGVHLDHSRDPGEVEHCLRAGYTSVMIDGSHLGFVDNVALTADAVALGRRYGAWVEGELTGLAGDEDASTTVTAGALTDPDQAADFVARTGVDALAVAVGNVHGQSSAPPQLDLDLLARIAEQVSIPLVLHGASGVSAADLREAVRLGVAKVNINTELRRAFLGALPAPGSLDGDSLPTALAPAIAAVEAVCREWIGRLAGDRAGPNRSTIHTPRLTRLETGEQ